MVNKEIKFVRRKSETEREFTNRVVATALAEGLSHVEFGSGKEFCCNCAEGCNFDEPTARAYSAPLEPYHCINCLDTSNGL